MGNQNRIGVLIDYETRSRVDLTLTGSYIYSRDESTEVMCYSMADVYQIGDRFKVDYESKRTWRFDTFEDFDQEKFGIRDDEFMFAYNAEFELNMTNNTMHRLWGMNTVDIEQVYCLKSLGLANGLPNGLANVSKAAPLKSPKDEEGHRLMLRMCKPNSRTGKFPYSPEMFERLVQYCDGDILAEGELLELCTPFTDSELAHYQETLRINQEGIPVDQKLVSCASELVAQETERILATVPINLKSVPQIKEYAAERGLVMAKTDQEHVAKYLKLDLHPEVREMLEAKALGIGSASVSKFEAFVNQTSPDGRLRGQYTFHGAARTGRWTSGGVQLQNLPRGVKAIAEPDKNGDWKLPRVREAIKNLDIKAVAAESGGRPFDGFISSVRSCLAAPEGYTFVQRDLSAIEARGVLWVAGAKGIDIFREFDKGIGEEPYMIFANKIGSDRFMGKQGILSTGYGVGAKTFMMLCESYGRPITRELADTCLNLYKEMFPEVPAFWKSVGDAATLACQNRGKIYTVDTPTEPVKFIHRGGHLLLKLPSGRILTYWQAKLVPNEWGKPEITYMASGTNGGWFRNKVWGGSMTGHIVQGFSSCILREILANMRTEGIPACMHTHDEAVRMCKLDEAETCYDKMGVIMKTPPEWAKGLPIESKGWTNGFYIKD